MYEPGLNRHEAETEWAALEDDLHTDPVGTLPELDRLVTRMLEEGGFELTDTIVGEGEEREVLAVYTSAHDITAALELDTDGVSPGDVASAISGYRSVFDYLIATRGAADTDLGATEAEGA